jgi:hypothetical protein
MIRAKDVTMQQTPPAKPPPEGEPAVLDHSGDGPASAPFGDQDLSGETPGPAAIVKVHRSPEDTWTLAVRLDFWTIRFEINYQIHGSLVWAGALLTVLGLAIAAAVAVPKAIGVPPGSAAAAAAAAFSGGAILAVGAGALIVGMRRR